MEALKFRIKNYILLSIGFAVAFTCTDTKSTEDPESDKSYKTLRYYVSLDGKDVDKGSKRHPFASLERNASNARIRILHADGMDNKTWDMKQGDKFGFALEIGTYRFENGKEATVAISNEGADGVVVADAVAFVKNFQARLEPANY